MRRTAWAAGCAAAVLALGAAACTGQGGGWALEWGVGVVPEPTVLVRAAPAGNGVALSQAAPASAQWIVGELSERDAIPDGCPVPTLSDMIVLDNTVGHNRAFVVWLKDDDMQCVASLRESGGFRIVSLGTRLDRQAEQWSPVWFEGWAIFTVFPGDAGKVVIKGDDDHVFGPPHQRVVDFGDGRELTVVEYAYLLAGPEKPGLSARAQVCPGTGQCRPARWIEPPQPTAMPAGFGPAG
ncbi:hypothetical protein ACFRAR_19945 [Kitasatospora sp. NPDC056651]|uniref:hypothetical protein n=1 Tax=Kitasatospora sp. NPDC056651 TaxID=3345892 RepID=UPI0036B7EEB3